MINNGVWLRLQSQTGQFIHLNNTINHKYNLSTIEAGQLPKKRPTSSYHYQSSRLPGQPSYGAVLSESIRSSMENYNYAGDRNPQQIYLRQNLQNESLLHRPRSSRHQISKRVAFESSIAKNENDVLLQKMCGILARENQYAPQYDKSQKYKDQLLNSRIQQKNLSSRRIYSENMRLLNTIQNVNSTIKARGTGTIIRRPLQADLYRKSAERYMQKKLAPHGTFSHRGSSNTSVNQVQERRSSQNSNRVSEAQAAQESKPKIVMQSRKQVASQQLKRSMPIARSVRNPMNSNMIKRMAQIAQAY